MPARTGVEFWENWRRDIFFDPPPQVFFKNVVWILAGPGAVLFQAPTTCPFPRIIFQVSGANRTRFGGCDRVAIGSAVVADVTVTATATAVTDSAHSRFCNSRTQ